jgi:hypothetical protein
MSVRQIKQRMGGLYEALSRATFWPIQRAAPVKGDVAALSNCMRTRSKSARRAPGRTGPAPRRLGRARLRDCSTDPGDRLTAREYDLRDAAGRSDPAPDSFRRVARRWISLRPNARRRETPGPELSSAWSPAFPLFRGSRRGVPTNAGAPDSRRTTTCPPKPATVCRTALQCRDGAETTRGSCASAPRMTRVVGYAFRGGP